MPLLASATSPNNEVDVLEPTQVQCLPPEERIIHGQKVLRKIGFSIFLSVKPSVGDPDPEPEPQDQHVFGPPGSGSIGQRYGSGSESFPCLIKVLSVLK